MSDVSPKPLLAPYRSLFFSFSAIPVLGLTAQQHLVATLVAILLTTNFLIAAFPITIVLRAA